jgi:hypothetical protein
MFSEPIVTGSENTHSAAAGRAWGLEPLSAARDMLNQDLRRMSETLSISESFCSTPKFRNLTKQVTDSRWQRSAIGAPVENPLVKTGLFH